MLKRIVLYLLASACVPTFFLPAHESNIILADRLCGSIFGGLIGDALGKPTEFIRTPQAIFEQYPDGVTSFEDLKKGGLCWKNKTSDALYAPYTDDTAMTRLNLKILIQSRIENWGIDTTMERLARAYVQDLDSPTGWAMRERAPGNSCLKSVKKLQNILKLGAHKPKNWWQAGDDNAAGCGAVMRAHAFGVVFADNPEKAAVWAAEHSKITHGHQMSQAACAAMALGTAYAIQGKSPEFIIEHMIGWAKKYDPSITRFNPYTKKQEKSCWGKMEDAVTLAQTASNRSPDLAQHDLVFGDNNMTLNRLFKKSEDCRIFHTYQGWAADDALAAALYTFALSPDNAHHAIVVGVHTPGDSDSIASMAGALVGARVGAQALRRHHDTDVYEGSLTLEKYGLAAFHLLNRSNHALPHTDC